MYNSNKNLKQSPRKETIEDVLKLPIRAIPERGITKETCKYFRVRVALSEKDGKTIEAIYFPYTKKGELVGYKKKDLTIPKHEDYHFTYVGKVNASCDLFGQFQSPTGGKKSFTVEGEMDVLATFQVLKEQYKSVDPAVTGIGGTSWAGQQIAGQLKYLQGFQENIILFDQDRRAPGEEKSVKKGYEATIDAAAILPTIKVAEISLNDPNQMLMEGKEEELFWALTKHAKPFKPEGFVTVEDVFEQATRMPEWGRPWPWPTLTKLTYGMRDGEGVYFGAGVKVGKSEALNETIHHILFGLKEKIAVFKFEEDPAMTIRKIAGKIKRKPFHKPDGDFTQEELIAGVLEVQESGLILFDSYGSTEWETVKAAIRHAVVVEGCRTIAIDPLTRLTTGKDAAKQNEELEKIADELSAMAKDLGFFYMIFCHLKAPLTGKSHEEGGLVKSNQFTGSRAMMRACYLMIGIERDKTKEDPIERNTSTFRLLEDRMFGRSGSFKVFYNEETGDYKEPVVEEF